MTEPPRRIDFYFDFISPFGYFASLRIDALGARHGLAVGWHPILIGVTVMKVMGMQPLMEVPLKGDYARREAARYCRRHGVALARAVDGAPMNPLPAGRAFAWLRAHAPADAPAFARAVFDAYWRQGRDLAGAAELRAAGQAAGLADDLVLAALGAPDAAALLRAEVDAALARGVFGSPYILVGDEPFFGVDKLELVEEWLGRGGW